MRTDLSTYDNNWFIPTIGVSRIKQVLWYFTSAIIFSNHLIPFNQLKVFLLRLFGATVGNNVIIKPAITIKYPWKLNIGNNCWVGENVWIDNLIDVKIGNNVCLSQGAFILTGNHNYSKSTFDLIIKPIVLEDGVWIGAQALVCPGVTCFSHSVLTARSVATRDLEAYTIYQGYPALAIKERVINP